jgi:LmbE family N-acetylglucosaminyl deacetylase
MDGLTGHLVLSPHPDDAVWSAGGRIARWTARAERVTVLTVFDGLAPLPPAGSWRAVASPEVRRAENHEALEALGADGVSAGIPDAALRSSGDQPRYASPLRLFGRVHPDDEPLALAIAQLIGRLTAAGPVLVHAPLAAGHHVDHVLTRRAAESVAGLGGRLAYYEDFPYRLASRDHIDLLARDEAVAIRPWLRAAACYHSQIDLMFGTYAAFAQALTARVRTDTGTTVRVWVPVPGKLRPAGRTQATGMELTCPPPDCLETTLSSTKTPAT